MGQSCCAQHHFDTNELDNIARTRYMKSHPNCHIEHELTSLSSELLEIAMRKTRTRKRKLILITSATSPIGKSIVCELASQCSEYIICGISSNVSHIKQMTDDLDKISSTMHLFNDDNSSNDDEDIESETSLSHSHSFKYKYSQANIANIANVDVCNEKKMALWIMDIFEEYGIPDIIINNSTIIQSNNSYSEFVSISDRNVTSYFYLIKYLMPSLIKRRNGIIINLTGTSHSIPAVFKNAYNASKYAMEGYVESLANKLMINGKSHSKNISFITMSIGALDMKSQRILAKSDGMTVKSSAKDSLTEELLLNQDIDTENVSGGVTFQRWASKTVPIIINLLDQKNKKKIYTNNKHNQYTHIDRIIDLNTMLKTQSNKVKPQSENDAL